MNISGRFETFKGNISACYLRGQIECEIQTLRQVCCSISSKQCDHLLNFLWVKLFFRPEQFFRGGSLFGEYSWGSGRLSASLLVGLGSFPNQHSFSFSVRYIATLNFRTCQNLKHIFWSEIRNETFFVSSFRFFLPISLRKLKRLAKT